MQKGLRVITLQGAIEKSLRLLDERSYTKNKAKKSNIDIGKMYYCIAL